MTIILNHTIVPARDRQASAEFFARIFGLQADEKHGHFAPVRVNDTLTLLFDEDSSFESHHLAFHVGDAEFDQIFRRMRGIKRVVSPTGLHQDALAQSDTITFSIASPRGLAGKVLGSIRRRTLLYYSERKKVLPASRSTPIKGPESGCVGPSPLRRTA